MSDPTPSQVHPAQYSPEVIDKLRELIDPGVYVHDPFAGPGVRLGALASEVGFEFTGTEIEPAFIEDARVWVGDSRRRDSYPWTPKPLWIVTSPVYANGMTDDFVPSGVCKACSGTGMLPAVACEKCDGTGRRKIDRMTYRWAKIRLTGEARVRLDDANMGRYGYRKGRRAYDEYWRIADGVVRQWGRAGAERALVNVSDFIKGGEIVKHCDEWVKLLETHEWTVVARHEITTRRNRKGANREARVEHEEILEATP